MSKLEMEALGYFYVLRGSNIEGLLTLKTYKF